MTTQLLHYVVEFQDGSKFDVHIDPNDPNSVTVDGASRDVRVDAGQNGILVSTEEGQRVPLQLRFEHGELIAETPDGLRQKVRVELAQAHEFRKKVLSQPPPPPIERSGRVVAAIAGNILSLSLKDGDKIEAGDSLLVLEAMKMQNTISAPVSGVVTYKVTPGQTVRMGDLLATIVAPGSN
jgi:biotin carboxyl carrier protein